MPGGDGGGGSLLVEVHGLVELLVVEVEVDDPLLPGTRNSTVSRLEIGRKSFADILFIFFQLQFQFRFLLREGKHGISLNLQTDSRCAGETNRQTGGPAGAAGLICLRTVRRRRLMRLA